MLTFFATLLVNVLIGTIFYLVISLKIEKSASEIHVQKIRKEMDGMIREFNSTADRNISLLENRISVMKRLLEKGGAAGIDCTLDDSVAASLKESKEEVFKISRQHDLRTERDQTKGFAGFISHSSEFIKSIGIGLKQAIHEVNTIKETEKIQKKKSAEMKAPTIDIRIGEDLVVNKESKESGKDGSAVYFDKDTPRSHIVREESELTEIFSKLATRKQAYELVTQLVGEGYTIESISHLSGIPAGEISLVVNLGGR